MGSCLLRLLIDDPRVDEIIAPSRRALPAMNKVVNPVEADLTDVLRPLEAPLTTVFCCLGTTRKQAGSKAAFIHVDYTLVVDTALWGPERCWWSVRTVLTVTPPFYTIA